MAILQITSDSLERLQGFLAGIEWTNDSVLSVVSVDPEQRTAVLCDRDAEEDRRRRLGPFGLEAFDSTA
ncbi:hypothetical protein [Thiohalocapsa marina]|uniref:hypothetical protein n=1 Tax=Thiohalocapsa marina TaxID=424902 RepID=UPI0036DB2FE5